MCGSAPKAPPAPVYKTSDGQGFSTMFEAQEYDRRARLAKAMGFEGSITPVQPAAPARDDFGGIMGAPTINQIPATDPFQDWLGADEQRKKDWAEFDGSGLTAGDYRAEQRQREETARREAAVAQGRQAIGSQFSKFGNDYYDSIKQSYLNYYTPQLKDKFKQAEESTVFDLARRGVGSSRYADDRMGQLQKALTLQTGQITNQADDAASKAKADVLSSRDDLLRYNESAADAGAVSERVGGITDRLASAAPQLTPLSQVFFDFITPVAGVASRGISAERAGYKGFGTGLFGGGYDTRSRSSYNEVGG